MVISGEEPRTVRSRSMVVGPRRLMGLVALWIFTGSILASAGLAVEPARDPVRWLQDYIQIDTTNPPGPPEEAYVFLEGLLDHPEIEVERMVSPAGWTSLWARLPATVEPGGDALLLMHHIDVVPAGEEWREPPFSGRRSDGKLWGRGALDVKSLGIAQIAAMLDLARSGEPRTRDIILLATPDEETGGEKGVGWLWEAQPEIFADVAGVLNEGGNNRVLGDRLLWWGIEIAQKRPFWVRVTARGRPGHGSTFAPRSATHRLLLGLARLVERDLEWKIDPSVRLYFEKLGDVEGREDSLGSRLDEVIRPEGPVEPLAPGLPGYFLDTLQVTRLENGTATNVVVPEAQAWIDCRLLPETDSTTFQQDMAEALGSDLEIEVLLDVPPSPASPVDSDLFQMLEEVLGVRAPVVPTFISGATDSRWFRHHGIPSYGISPFSIDARNLKGIHGPNESIPEADLRRGVETVRRLLEAWVTGGSDPTPAS